MRMEGMSRMTASTERDLRLLAWKPDDPPSPGLLAEVEGDLLGEALSQISQEARDQIIQATLDELTHMGLVEADENGRYWLTTAGHAALDDSPGDDGDGLGGPVWMVTLYRPARDLPWVIGQVTEAAEAGQAGSGLVCLAGADGRA
jgi:hypothetical protein